MGVFKIQRGEWPVVALLFSNFFLIITAYYVIKAIREALVIQSMGANALPYVWTATMMFLIVFVWLYSGLIDKLDRKWVVATTVLFFAVSLLAVRALMDTQWNWVSALLYIWSDVFSVIVVEQFWSLINDIFKQKDARRLYGVIGSGGILGGICGGGIVSLVVPMIGTSNMIYVCMGILILLMASVFAVEKIIKNHQIPKNKNPSQDKHKADFFEGFRLIFTNRYITLICVSLVLVQMTTTVIDFQFMKSVESSFVGLDEKSIFMGQFLVILNVVSFLIMIFLVGPVNEHVGLLAGLLVLPVVNLIGIALFLTLPGNTMIYGLKLADKGFNYSFNRASKEVLYTPLGKAEKYKAKAVIDMFVFRASKFLGSGLIVGVSAFFSLTALNYCTLAFCSALIVVTVVLYGKFKDLTGIKRPEPAGVSDGGLLSEA